VRTRKIVALLGPPASGKGTQAVKLARHMGGLHISTGYLLRQAVLNQTPLGIQALRYVDAGELVPDALVLDVLRETLSKISDSRAAILDGFPRTLPQALSLETFLPPERVIFIELPDEEVIRRISGRRIGPGGEPYHVVNNPPPPGIVATQRSDDREEIVRERLQVDKKQTQPLLDYYDRCMILHRVSGLGSIDEVFNRLLPLLP